MIARLVTALLMVSSFAAGYYHFVHFSLRNQSFIGFVEKFDLNALPDRTVTYQIAETGPSQFAEGDSLTSLVSEIRLAAQTWSSVPTSSLRLRFGGFAPVDAAPSTTPSIDVVFEELPPGVNGYGGPTSRGDVLTEAGFVPVQRSIVVLNRDMAKRASWTEQFYLTAVHEFGHALGLQHSFTSGAMATEITRGTTKARPLTPDDEAGLSVLYPTEAFRASLGTIIGRVTSRDQGVAMASVVAISPRGAAVSALTNPDGTFRIEGLPPGAYFVYAHPLPPAAFGEATNGAVVAPLDEQGKPLEFGPSFDTVFFPSSRTPEVPVYVQAGKVNDSIDFSVNRRSIPAIYGVQTYSFPAQIAVKPAHLYTGGGARNFLVATGTGLLQNGKPTPGLEVQTLGGFATVIGGTFRSYAPAPTYYVQADFQFSPFAEAGPGHLLFTTPSDIYVLPYGFRLADRPAPTISAITLREDGVTALIEGQNLRADTLIRFDGEIAPVHSEQDGKLVVALPTAPSDHRAAVSASQPDGQSSLFLQSATPFTFQRGDAFAGAAAPSLDVNSLPAGTESLIEISLPQAYEAGFEAGFSTGDVRLRRTWRVSASKLLANIWIAPAAAGRVVDLTVARGLLVTTEKSVLQITAQPSKPVRVRLPDGVAGLIPGTTAQLIVSGLDLRHGASVRLGELTIAPLRAEEGIIEFSVPDPLPAGPVAVRVRAGEESSLPLGMDVLPKPLSITSIRTGNEAISEAHPAKLGDLLTVTISGLPESTTSGKETVPVEVLFGGVPQGALDVAVKGNVVEFQFVVSGAIAGEPATLTATVAAVSSVPREIPLKTK